MLLAVGVLTFGLARKASAEFISSGFAYADGIFIRLDFNPIIGKSITVSNTPFPLVSGSAPAPFFSTATGIAFGFPPLSISELDVNASSDVDGLKGARFAHADTTIANLSLGGLPLPLLPPILTLNFASISTTADVTGTPGALVGTASTTLTQGVLTIPYFGVGPIFLTASPAPNTQVGLPALGLSVLLNEQFFAGDGKSFQQANVIGVDIDIRGLPITSGLVPLGTLDMRVLIAHDNASLRAVVPEPPTYLLATTGGLLLMFWLGRGQVLRRVVHAAA
jgi:hypothetical protein